MPKISRWAGAAVLAAGLAAATSAPAFAADSGTRVTDPGPRAENPAGLGGVGDLVNSLAGGAGTLSFLLPSPNGSGANFVTGLMNNPAGAITGTPDSILPYGLLDGGKPQPLG
ncbi:hypothetical protein FHX82_004710 [Amycolatopsis bartoniae]|uniref:Uncharacterized protein n=1 Tax=Amycolatopsis bartoniae TaxID=941986 RepID=A0A8H9IZR0_9PSEU|nr:hypothetical protein [Amycolatopsis bartoniae]MBB2937637.1 hypothetical protein [Amycolatopsis bartoniae]TVT00625.1 hypothetical protein FNH07_31295 [Amycolatopsis bartoniae]GHF82719.1 hypothetical protein GCM10017566_66130 [Amycolatopsis bartoniae]